MSQVTQCPHCRTSFRVSDTQLSAANGAVRCGACLQVFIATSPRLEPTVSPPVSPPTPAAAAPTAPTEQTLWIHDDLDLDSLDLDEELAKLEREETQLSQSFLALDGPSFPGPAARPPSPQPHTPYDEEWTEALLRDTPSAAPSAEPEPPVASPIEVDPEPELTAPLEPEPALVPLTESEPALPPKTAPLFDLADEPLDLDWQRPPSPWGRRLLWSLLILLAALGLVAQYASYHFDELARQDRFRPWYEWVCPHLGCQLPAKVDISQIRSSNLVVRAHPDFTGALIVDAILYNRAAFAQPFPLLEMRFSDSNGQSLASRRFKPAEYLAGELAGQTEMPPQTPIRIALEILDPGPQATSYSLDFKSPE